MKKILVALGILALVLGIVAAPYLISVKIGCKSQFGSCPNDIEEKLLAGKSKSLAGAKKSAEKILKNNFLVSDFSLQYKLPNILLVNLIVRKPEFSLKNSSSGQVANIGSDGRALSITSDMGLPEVVGNFDLPKVGDTVSPESLLALNLQNGVFEMYQVRMGTLNKDSLVVELPMPTRVIFPLQGDRDVLLGALRLIFSKIESGDEHGKYSEIDLRFKNPVLR